MSALMVTAVCCILSLFLHCVTSRNCTELQGSSDVSTSFSEITARITARIIVSKNCTVTMVFTQPMDTGYTGWAFGGDYTLRGKSLMNGYSIMVDKDGTALEYELRRYHPYYYKQNQQDLDCNILNENNLLTVTCYRKLYTNDSYDYFEGWSTYGTIDVMWCWDKSGSVSPGNTHSKEGFTQMDMGNGANPLIYEIIGFSLAGIIILMCGFYFIGKKCGVTACVKRNVDKYCWNIFVDAYYGIFCCHFCKLKGTSLMDMDDQYARSPRHEVHNHSMRVDNDTQNRTGGDYSVQVR